jgi:predicted AAA+ superfamily ATPase
MDAIMIRRKYARWKSMQIKEALKSRRVVLLEGSRQCGKTTLAKELATDKTIYLTLDDVTLLDSAINDPHGFVRHGDNLMIIDEVQRAPLLLQAVKQDVDENQSYGRFMLTGSANIQSLPNVKESLAGRVSKVRLRPLALGEYYENGPSFIKNAFEGVFNVAKYDPRLGNVIDDKDSYLSFAFHGGYPEALSLDDLKDVKLWHQDYLEALIEHDLKDIAKVNRKDSLFKLIEVLAAWSSKFMDISAIGRELSLARPTIETYINALETLYLVERVRPWHTTDYNRASKQDKLFMTDAGLMASILRWRFDKVRLDGDMNGKLIETFVFTQLSAILDAQNDDYELYHYRDREKREVDFIIKNENGDIIGIEVKSGSAVNKSSFKHLKWFKNNLTKDNNFKGIVLYSGEHIVPFGEDMWVVPINSLWA